MYVLQLNGKYVDWILVLFKNWDKIPDELDTKVKLNLFEYLFLWLLFKNLHHIWPEIHVIRNNNLIDINVSNVFVFLHVSQETVIGKEQVIPIVSVLKETVFIQGFFLEQKHVSKDWFIGLTAS